MKAVVDVDTCIGCELCCSTCPDVFEMDGDHSVGGDIPVDCEDDAKEAMEGCPVDAISIED